MMKPILGYEGLYSITDDGKIYSHTKKYGKGLRKGKWMKHGYHDRGYPQIILRKNKVIKCRRIHRLVAQAFIPNPENKPEINHKNGIKTDNSVENLEWVTRLENVLHAFKIGLSCNKGENHSRTKLTWKDINEMRNNHNYIKKEDKIWKNYGITQKHYFRIIQNKSWKIKELQ